MKTKKHFSCNRPFTHIHISWDGFVTPCSSMIRSPFYEKMRELFPENWITNKTLRDVLKKSRLFKIIRESTLSEGTPPCIFICRPNAYYEKNENKLFKILTSVEQTSQTSDYKKNENIEKKNKIIMKNFRKVVVDKDVLLRILFKKKKNKSKIVKTALNSVKTVLVPLYALIEIAESSRKDLKKLLLQTKKLKKLKIVPVNSKIIMLSLKLSKKYNVPLRLSMYAAISLLNKCPIISYNDVYDKMKEIKRIDITSFV